MENTAYVLPRGCTCYRQAREGCSCQLQSHGKTEPPGSSVYVQCQQRGSRLLQV